jgi:hypothetical protein
MSAFPVTLGGQRMRLRVGLHCGPATAEPNKGTSPLEPGVPFGGGHRLSRLRKGRKQICSNLKLPRHTSTPHWLCHHAQLNADSEQNDFIDAVFYSNNFNPPHAQKTLQSRLKFPD